MMPLGIVPFEKSSFIFPLKPVSCTPMATVVGVVPPVATGSGFDGLLGLLSAFWIVTPTLGL